MSDHVENLLQAEQAIEDLQAEIERLMAEIGGYASARTSLEQTQQQLVQLVQRQSQLVDHTATIIRKLGEIGTPQLMEKLDRVSEQHSTVSQAIEQATSHLTEQIEGTQAKNQELTSTVTGHINSVGAAVEQSLTKSHAASEVADEKLTKRINLLLWLVTITLIAAIAGACFRFLLSSR